MPMERMTGDYISRDELVDTLDERIEKCEEALPLTPAQVHEMKGEVNATKAIRVFVKRFPAADVRPRWIPVTERLPEYGTTVLVYGSQGGIYTARYERARAEWDRDSWWKLNSKSHICNPTHWMPLPEPPKGE